MLPGEFWNGRTKKVQGISLGIEPSRCHRILIPCFSELIGTDISSGVIQTLIVILAKVSPKECKKFCKLIATDCLLSKDEKSDPEEKDDTEEENGAPSPLDPDIPEPFQYQAVCRTIEVILSQAEVIPKLYGKLWRKLFSGKLVKLAQHELANYTVQKLLSTCPDKDMVRNELAFSFLDVSFF